jgi:predicted  nucleic acid-binding Zn-ribbon protein
MSEQLKLSQDELNFLKKLQSDQQTLVTQFGQLEYQMQILELQKDQLVETLNKLREQELTTGNELTQKYGNGTIDLESGTFTKTE